MWLCHVHGGLGVHVICEFTRSEERSSSVFYHWYFCNYFPDYDRHHVYYVFVIVGLTIIMVMFKGKNALEILKITKRLSDCNITKCA